MVVEHRYDSPERFVAGTVGEPGARAFFLQARSGSRITSVALEKEQVRLLGERMETLLDDLMRAQGGDAVIPALAPEGTGDDGPLELPIEEEFRAGTMTLAWDAAEQHVVIEVFPLEDSDLSGESTSPADDGTASEVFLVSLTPAAARAFSKRAVAVVSAGRPSCQFCGNPMDPAGHLCPRMNGFKRR